jgi:uncharacterized protein YbjT (DUF2867 family)
VLGRLVVQELESKGHSVRAVVRRTRHALQASGSSRQVRTLDALRPGAWSGVCDGINVVVSALGASVDPSPWIGRRTFTRVDAPANLALLEEARRAGVGRFVYVSLAGGAQLRTLDYAEGHERVVDALRKNSMSGTVVRPTGFFCAMSAFIGFARRGVVPVIGNGSSRTNPIDERDVAGIVAAAASSDEDRLIEVGVGGPEVFTRRRIAELAFESLEKRPRVVGVPPWVARLGSAALLPFNPRAAHLTRFAAHVMTHECVESSVGVRRLDDYFSECAARSH